jgi:hypothetical protein
LVVELAARQPERVGLHLRQVDLEEARRRIRIGGNQTEHLVDRRHRQRSKLVDLRCAERRYSVERIAKVALRRRHG